MENLSRIDIFGQKSGTQTEINKAKKKLEKLEKSKQETQDGAILKNAIEWRFEFPNLLNDSGDFIGFDIVIANPPYIRQELFKDIKPRLKCDFGEFYNGRADLYTFFYKKGSDILKHNGCLDYITSNKFFKRGYGENTRKLLFVKCLSACLF